MSAIKNANIFNRVLRKRSEWLKSQGVDVPLFSNKKVFQQLDEKEQESSIARLKILCAQIEPFQPNSTESDKFREFCKNNKLTPTDERVFNSVDERTCWEIVTFDMQQLYRNPVIYSLSSYSLEEFEGYSPWVLFNRPEKSFEDLMEATARLKKSDEMIDLNFISPYVIEEALSEEKRQFQIQHKIACPLLHSESSERVAFVSVFTTTVVDTSNQSSKIKILN